MSEEIKVSKAITVNSVNHDRVGSVSIKFNDSTIWCYFGNFLKEFLLN